MSLSVTSHAANASASASSKDLSHWLTEIQSAESALDALQPAQADAVAALRAAIDGLHREAFARFIRKLKDEPGAASALRAAVRDDVVYAVLRHLGVVKPSLNERVEQALIAVRPSLQAHGGDVELVDVCAPDTVDIRLIGSCDGCPSSTVTLAEGVEKAIKDRCPEITTIRTVKRGTAAAHQDQDGVPVHFVSPFAVSEKAGWQDVMDLEQVPNHGLTVKDVCGRSMLFSRDDQRVSCFDNACAHMGMPLDMGRVENGLLTCPHHGFQYVLTTGECLTAPEVQLASHAVRVVGTRVQVKITA